MLRSCEQRRDRALNNLYLLRKDEAQRSREAKQSLPNMQTSKSQVDVEIMPTAGN
jgi:hypothetical protein